MLVRRTLLVLLALMMALSLMPLAGCGGGAEEPATTTEEPAPEVPAIDEGAAIIDATFKYLSSDIAQAWIMNAADLNKQLFEEADASMQVVDIRDSADYAKGHIDGAINVPFEDFADEATLDQLDSAKTLVIADYDGSKSPAIHMYLTQLGYDVITLRFGMSGWTTDAAVVGTVWDGVGAGYPTTTEPTVASGSFEIPNPSTGAADEREAIINGAKAYFASGAAELMTAAELKAKVDAGAEDMVLVSMQKPEDYAVAHVPGTINIPAGKLATAAALSTLDPSKTIVLVCYQGHNSSFAQFFLKQLGYDAVSVHYGFSAWTNDPAQRVVKTYAPANVPNLPTVK